MSVMASLILACNIQAIGAVQQPRYGELVSRLRAAILDRTELADGYRYSLDSAKITPPEVAEWIALERWCCPFLNFELDASRLTMRGPEGVKAVLQDEFPVRQVW
jgi:hypothetical protein